MSWMKRCTRWLSVAAVGVALASCSFAYDWELCHEDKECQQYEGERHGFLMCSGGECVPDESIECREDVHCEDQAPETQCSANNVCVEPQ